MKRTVRLNERQLHRVVNEAVKMVLNEEINSELFDEIDNQLQQLGDAYVSKFYSDEYNITLAVNKNIRGEQQEIIDIMNSFGYDYYDAGANGEYVMMTFKPIE